MTRITQLDEANATVVTYGNPKAVLPPRTYLADLLIEGDVVDMSFYVECSGELLGESSRIDRDGARALGTLLLLFAEYGRFENLGGGA